MSTYLVIQHFSWCLVRAPSLKAAMDYAESAVNGGRVSAYPVDSYMFAQEVNKLVGVGMEFKGYFEWEPK